MAIPEVEYIWMNGELVPWGEAKVHVLTHALHYGSGVFEGIRCYAAEKGAAVFRLTDHLRRLERSAKLYYMPIPYTVDQLRQATFDVIAANGLSACYIRPLVYRGYGEMGLFPLKCPVDVIIAAWSWGAYLGEEGIAHGIRAKTSSIQSLDHTSLARAAKGTGQYLNSILAKVEVTKAGYDEAIMLNERGHVAEGSGENIFVVRDGVLATPPTADGVLEGITRATVFDICRSEGIPCEERTLPRSDLVIADELFYTGTAAEIVPIREVDDHPIGEPGPLTRRIQERFRAIVEGRDSAFAHYAEYVLSPQRARTFGS
ncbi:MAG: branched-chain amino acid transaminase [Actinobacteria bacterium]|nr:branched-chain amino acid transaminase [Actinomycetota bacterium]